MIPHGKSAIYGLIDPDTKKCRYIGQTINPKQRAKAHGFQNSKGYGLEFLIFVYCDQKDASKVETLLIKGFKKIGQADLNIRLWTRQAFSKNSFPKIKWKETGMMFNSRHEAAQYFNCSDSTMCNVMNKYGGILKSWTVGLYEDVTLEEIL